MHELELKEFYTGNPMGVVSWPDGDVTEDDLVFTDVPQGLTAILRGRVRQLVSPGCAPEDVAVALTYRTGLSGAFLTP